MRRQRSIVYAGRGERILANLIDSVILVIPGGMMAAALGGGGLAIAATFMTSLAYYTFFTASKWQATPGKRLLNIYVVRTNHKPIDVTAGLERFLAYIIPSLPLYSSFLPPDLMPVVVLWLSVFWFLPIVYTPERTGIHDRLCHTRVLVGKVG